MNFLVLGVGNIMFADEGLGVHLCKLISKNYAFSHPSYRLDFIDGGTLGLRLSYIIAKYDKMVVLDCLETDDGEVGEVFFFPYEAMPAKVSFSGSAHEVEMLQTLQYMELAGDLPQTHILGFIPKRIEPMSFELSAQALKAAFAMEQSLLNFLQNEGFTHQKIANFTLQELALKSYKNED